MRSFLSPIRKSLPVLFGGFLSIWALGAVWGCSDDISPVAPEYELPPVESGSPAGLSALHEAAQLSPIRLEVELQAVVLSGTGRVGQHQCA